MAGWKGLGEGEAVIVSLYEIEVTDIRGNRRTMGEWRGQVLLIVNTATGCGFAPQFKALQELYERYRERGFAVLGFPCAQFMRQELNDNAKIADVCRIDHGVTFPLFARIDVNGRNAHPLFRLLKREARGVFGTKAIKWNFTKFLVDRKGRVARRFAPSRKPEGLERHIRALLNEPE